MTPRHDETPPDAPEPGGPEPAAPEPAASEPGPEAPAASAPDPLGREAAALPADLRGARRRVPPWAVRLLKVVVLALALWLVARLLAGLGWADLRQRLATASPAWLAAAVVALVVRYVVWDERWRAAIRADGPLPPRRLTFAALLAAATVNTITPAVRVIGGVVRARYVGRAIGRPTGRAYGSVLFDQLAHQAVTGGVTLVAAFAAAFAAGLPRLGAALAAAVAGLAAALAVWSARRGGGEEGMVRRLASRVAARVERAGRLGSLLSHGRDAVDSFTALVADRRLRLRVVVLGLVFVAANAGAQWMVFAALGAPVSPWIVLVVVALGSAAGILVGTPGGLGAAEATMIASFAALGVDRLDATAASLLYRALHFAVTLGLGVPCLVWLEARYGR